MKITSYIILVSFLMLVAAPTVILLGPQVLTCGSSCMPADEQEGCDVEDVACFPPGTCGPGQCCICCFLCIIDHQKIQLRIFQSHYKAVPAGDQRISSDFIPDCWQPPEFA